MIAGKEATMVFEVYAAIGGNLAVHIPAENYVEQLHVTIVWRSWEELGSFDPDPDVRLKLQERMAYDKGVLPPLEQLQRGRAGKP